MPVISWLADPLLAAAAFITRWFLADDSANFGVVQMAIAVLLLTGIVALLVFAGGLLARLRGRKV